MGSDGPLKAPHLQAAPTVFDANLLSTAGDGEGIAMLALPYCSSQAMLFIPMIGIGLGWASMMGNPYIILADSIPPARTGIYMGIFNMFIVIPMMIESLTMPLIYRPLLGGDPRHVLMLAGVLMLLAAVATLAIRERPAARASA